jgi:hydroxymethylglutaryl-CoA lyase
MTEFVEIFEVGPRDGLQNEARAIPAAEKIALVDQLSLCGFQRIEVASFVSPKWVPQMADGAGVLAGLRRMSGIGYWALTPNQRGLDDALVAKADGVAVFGAASEGFSRANINATIGESLARFRPLVADARARDLPVRGYVSCVVSCPYDGVVAPGSVARVAAALWDMGCTEISLGETLGQAFPEDVDPMLAAVRNEVPAAALAGHFHDTRGRALENIDVALAHGLRIFDGAVGGLGGCPYAPGAAGNVDTVAVAKHLSDRGYDTGLDIDKLHRAADYARSLRGQEHRP